MRRNRNLGAHPEDRFLPAPMDYARPLKPWKLSPGNQAKKWMRRKAVVGAYKDKSREEILLLLVESRVREQRFVEMNCELKATVEAAYADIVGPHRPDGNAAASAHLLVELIGGKHHEARARIADLEAKLAEWVKPCFCADGRAKCLMCETRELLEKGGSL